MLIRKNGNLISSSRWLMFLNLSKFTAQFFGLAIVARMISPNDFGLMALVTVVTGFAGLLRDFSTGYYIVQKRFVNISLLSTVSFLNLVTGTVAAVIVFSSAGFFSEYYSEPELVPMLKVVALVFPFSALGAIYQAMLERNSNFKAVSIIELVSYVAGLVVAVALARTGFGVWALIFQFVINSLLSAILFFKTSPYAIPIRFKKRYFYGIWNYSGSLTLYNFLSALARSAETFFLAKTLGVDVFGLFNMALKFIGYPIQIATMIASRSLLPVLSASQSSPGVFNNAVLTSAKVIYTVLFPVIGFMYVYSEVLITAAFGEKWELSAHYFSWGIVAGVLGVINIPLISALLSKQKTAGLMKLMVVYVVIQYVTYLGFIEQGSTTLLSVYVVLSGVFTLMILINALNVFSLIFLKKYIFCLTLPLILTISDAWFVLYVKHNLFSHGYIVAAGGMYALIYGFLLFKFDRCVFDILMIYFKFKKPAQL